MFAALVFRLLLRVWCGMAILFASGVVIVHFVFVPAQNPLQPYRALVPGTSESVLASDPIPVRDMPYMPGMSSYSFYPGDKFIRGVNVTMDNAEITSVVITTNALPLGEVIERWGLPTHTYDAGSYRAYQWNCGVWAISRMRRIDPTLLRSLATEIRSIWLVSSYNCDETPRSNPPDLAQALFRLIHHEAADLPAPQS